jgi:hypothetical protein
VSGADPSRSALETQRRRAFRLAALLGGLGGAATLGLAMMLVWQAAANGWAAMLGAGLVPGVVGVTTLGVARGFWRRSREPVA